MLVQFVCIAQILFTCVRSGGSGSMWGEWPAWVQGHSFYSTMEMVRPIPEALHGGVCVFHFTNIILFCWNPGMGGMQKVPKLKPSEQDCSQVLFREDYTSLHLGCSA